MAEYCEVVCNWECDKDLTYITSYFHDELQDDYNTDSANNSMKLEVFKPPNDECCQLDIRSKSLYHVGINGIRVVSESRNLEVYSQLEGYQQTVRGKVIPQDEGNQNYEKLFVADILISEPKLSIMLKFRSLSGKQSFNIQQIQIYLTAMDPSKVSTGMDVGKLRAQVEDLGDRVSDRAKSLLDTIENYQKSQQGSADVMKNMISSSMPGKESPIASMNGLLNMFAQMKNSRVNSNPGLTMPVNSPQGTTADLASNLLSQMSLGQNKNSARSDDMYNFLHSVCGKVSNERNTKNTGASQANKIKSNDEDEEGKESLKLDILDEVSNRIKIAEERILTEMSEMESRLNNKLDTILDLLSSSNQQLQQS